MEKDIIKNISIEDFKTNKNFVDYIDDDFLVANSLENIPYSSQAELFSSDFLHRRMYPTGYEQQNISVAKQ